jgi:rare lipoprotein A (peptidoglycan hydrolase)
LLSLRSQRSRVAVLVAVLAVALCAPATAAPSATTQLLSAQEQASVARAKMDRMRNDLESGISRYEAASGKLVATRAKIAENTERLAKIDQSVKEGQEHLATRADFQYRTGTPGMIDVLFGASSFEDFSSRLYVFSEIVKQDAELLATLKAQRAEAVELRSDLKKREATQSSELAQVASRQSTVQKQVDAQDRYLDSLSAEVSSLVAAQDKARAAAAVSSAAKSSPAPSRAPKPSKTPVSKAGAIVFAAVEGRPGKYAVVSGDPLTYRPTGVKFSGVTTMYGNDDNGTGTSSGRRFDENEFTCAHKTLPFGTRIAVTKGGRSVIVTVTDRGPFTPGRMLDLTRRSARYLGVDGVGTVKCEIVQPVR